MAKGRSLELYFIDGKPDGMLTAEVFNWTGHVLMTPRTRIKDALGREEAGYTGVYILLGETEDGPQAYIGEAEDLGKRLRDHVKGKDWWETAVLITSTANNLHKAHVKYLESRLVEIALSTKLTSLENGNQPPRSSLSESSIANMEEFLETLVMVLPAIQVDMFVNRVRPMKIGSDGPEHYSYPSFELVTPKHGIRATAIIKDSEMVVQAGSKARKEWSQKVKPWNEKSKDLHQKLLENGILKLEGDYCIFTKNYAFPNVSAAAAVIQGRAANGRDWKLKGTNTTYAEWEAAQLAETDTPT